jgi:hypothetical protein
MPACVSRSVLAFMALIFAGACTSTAEAPKASITTLVEKAEVKATPSCEDETFCTREYLPTSCQFGDQTFSGSNPCEARKEAKHYACEKGLVLTNAQVKCQPQEGRMDARVKDKDCQVKSFCTQEMDPHSCTFGGAKFSGNNRCEALQKVRAFACQKGLILDEKTLVCSPGLKEKAG